jgi:hypothetical protein
MDKHILWITGALPTKPPLLATAVIVVEGAAGLTVVIHVGGISLTFTLIGPRHALRVSV